MKNLLSNALGQFRIISLAEGISFILLLGLAMPLKYIGDDPTLVYYLGRIHGGLFVIFAIALFRAADYASWRLPRVLLAFIASLVPLGAFFLEKTLKREYAEAQS